MKTYVNLCQGEPTAGIMILRNLSLDT